MAVALERKKLILSDPGAESILISAAVNGTRLDVAPDDFTDPVWVRAYRFILSTHKSGESISPELLKRRLELSPEKYAMLRSSKAEEISACVRIIKELSSLRKLRSCMNDLFTGGEPALCLEQALDSIREHKSSGVKNDFKKAGALLDAGIKETEWGIFFGFPQVDAWTRGMHRGDLILLAGRPSHGKTTLAVQIASKVSLGGKVAFYSLETRSQQIATKAACSISNLPADKIAWDEDALQKANMMSLYISDSSIQTPAAVYSSAVRLKESVGLDLIVIDYLQLLRLGRKIESREQEISEISRSLKLMAMELDVPIVALSQLSREVEKRGGRPRMADLRGSGSLEQDADLVFFIYDTKKDGHELILDKQRNGPTGFVKVIMHPEVSRFEEAFPA